MKIVTTNIELENALSDFRKKNNSIAFIPTMGALHPGHIELVKTGKKLKAKTVVSIFVNPTQFNNADDLAKYPRTLEKDISMLTSVKCDILFTPTVEEIYPVGLNTEIDIDLNGLDKPMEGEFRPGHFKGMLQVVKRLTDLVKADFLIMGQKDFQQFTLVNKMIKKLRLPVKLIVCPTLREKDGLAMSSRNQRLSPEFRDKAPELYKTLIYLKNNLRRKTPSSLEKEGMERLQKGGFEPEYVRIVNGTTLKQLRSATNTKYIVACLACWAGNVRLIDNLILKGSPN